MSKTKILIVDDEPNNQRILHYTLNKAGYEALVAGSGRSALTMLAANDPALAILDVSMPDMDGITLLKEIRSLPSYKTLPVIILTGSGDDAERDRAEAIGIQGFITKPASSRTVLEIVGGLLEKHAKN